MFNINMLYACCESLFSALLYYLCLLYQGTQIYDPKAGGWRDLGMLDVMQVKVNIMLAAAEIIFCMLLFHYMPF